MFPCFYCDNIVGRKNGVFCRGPWINLFNADWVNIPGEIANY